MKSDKKALMVEGLPKLLLLLGLCVFIAACNSSGNTYQMSPVMVQEYSSEPYKIGVGDQIRVDVWGNEKLSLDVPVRPDGMISMSLIGDVLAAGNTTESLSEAIAKELLVYIKSPQVTVIVTNPSSSDFQSRIRVTGAVNSPQSVPYRKGMTVLDLVLMAGGVNQFAIPSEAKLYRRVSSEIKVYDINLDDILKYGKLETNYMLVPSDIVTVPERSF
ncbi:MAG: sugar ABC transporter substrate-binding protein [Oceanicoccus sp.]|uniref:XrtA/PEP-CTERM system exopolysaccharide export protein n=1 Tax=Oceanicoccus sp. TaxID=2691044 RepID=UPI00260867AD|nr:XrtA/PEP-CTERM system exopolysaccharide export protein [Oceanicoccus sp.]MCP3907739.1 sugar ABC transporter substrate-binding protein [Oceanicoccus sp.]MDG1772694.1 polysaccharide biosynthesis/export family protein [Oceanicoccus sp.]